MSSLTKILTSETDGTSRLARKKMKQSTLFFTLAIFFATLVIAGAVVFVAKPEWFPFMNTKSATESAKPAVPSKASGYVAVFLTNNQVYFGKLSNLDGQYATLSDVYYLRVQRSLSEGLDASNVKVEDKKAQSAAQAKNDLTLIKLGDELHGPTDEIKLNRDHILLIEDLKEDSKVVKAIEQFKTKK